ncbi:MAG: nuclear transport factor 2 family protein [Pseudomonadota bacterium]|nr:nuclear transport factor 2 family protein [Pseudomonadota bacterium]
MISDSTARCADPRVARIVDAFEALTAADVSRLGEFYAADADFKDPFNEVRGVPAIQRVFDHMYVALDAPRFVVHDVLVQGDQCVLTWDFLFRFRRFSRELQTVRGASHLKLDSHGLITLHRDYWDAAEELYEKLPAVGALMRWLKRQANS